MLAVRALAVAAALVGCAMTPSPAGTSASEPGTDVIAAKGATPAPTPSATPKPTPTPVEPSKPPASSYGMPAGWPSPCPDTAKPFVAGQVLVGFQEGHADTARATFRQDFGVIAERSLMPGVWVMRVPCDADIAALVKRMGAAPGVRYAEPDSKIQLDDPIKP